MLHPAWKVSVVSLWCKQFVHWPLGSAPLQTSWRDNVSVYIGLLLRRWTSICAEGSAASRRAACSPRFSRSHSGRGRHRPHCSVEGAGQSESRVKTNCSHGYAYISGESAGIGAWAGFHHCAERGGTCSIWSQWQRTRNWAVVLKAGIHGEFSTLVIFFDELDGRIWRQPPATRGFVAKGAPGCRFLCFFCAVAQSLFFQRAGGLLLFLNPQPCALQPRFPVRPRFDALTLPNAGTSPGISSGLSDFRGISEFSVITHQSDCCGI